MVKPLILLPILFLLSCDTVTKTNAGESPKYQLVWQDEFEYSGLPDSSKWAYDIGGHGWGNNELQFYSERRLENARVEYGVLIIEARNEEMGGMDFTSARLVTKGQGDWLYGRIEVKAKLPFGKGTWPAIWMLPSNNDYGRWPKSGEIDIMEHVGFEQGKIHGSIHTEAFNHIAGTQKTSDLVVDDTHENFHVYSIDWSSEKIDFLVDEMKYFTFDKTESVYSTWPFDHSFYLILNLAVGGNWGGQQGVDESIWPQRLEIDYVRVFQKEQIKLR